MSLLILSVALTISPVWADGDDAPLTTLTTVNGQRFEGVEVLKHDPDGLMFRHSRGMAKVPFADLPEAVQKRFNYKPEAAAAFVKEHLDAEKEAKAKAEAARAAARERKEMEKVMRMQMQLLKAQGMAGDGGYIIPGFADFGVPTWGYGAGIGFDYWPDMGNGKVGPADLAKRKYQWDRDRLFGDFSTMNYIGPNAPLYSGAVTNSNVRPFSTFGGYRFPTELAVRAGTPLTSAWRNGKGHHPVAAAGVGRDGRPVVRPVPGVASPRRLVPANSAGARVGGTGTLMQGGANRISHQ